MAGDAAAGIGRGRPSQLQAAAGARRDRQARDLPRDGGGRGRGNAALLRPGAGFPAVVAPDPVAVGGGRAYGAVHEVPCRDARVGDQDIPGPVPGPSGQRVARDRAGGGTPA